MHSSNRSTSGSMTSAVGFLVARGLRCYRLAVTSRARACSSMKNYQTIVSSTANATLQIAGPPCPVRSRRQRRTTTRASRTRTFSRRPASRMHSTRHNSASQRVVAKNLLRSSSLATCWKTVQHQCSADRYRWKSPTFTKNSKEHKHSIDPFPTCAEPTSQRSFLKPGQRRPRPHNQACQSWSRSGERSSKAVTPRASHSEPAFRGGYFLRSRRKMSRTAFGRLHWTECGSALIC